MEAVPLRKPVEKTVCLADIRKAQSGLHLAVRWMRSVRFPVAGDEPEQVGLTRSRGEGPIHGSGAPFWPRPLVVIRRQKAQDRVIEGARPIDGVGKGAQRREAVNHRSAPPLQSEADGEDSQSDPPNEEKNEEAVHAASLRAPAQPIFNV
jgi:hypothetical protein